MSQQYPIEANAEVTPPPPTDQLKEIDVNESLVLGASYYLLSDKWWTAFQRFARYAVSMDDKNYHPGPVDNSALFENSESLVLRSSLVDRNHYTILTEVQWNKLVSW